ncbi:TPR-like protein [Caulochytrium protostelioides]|uniref:RNA polymerase II-associated protein 3 n=1 Tax=Caulochytrium protostelioides TaxID=1555241 RepID=A0A4P9X0U7_9FUNG|nr:TPR-like protein [Caulochytrium protostelioides]
MSADIAAQIRRNAGDYQSFVQDLTQWQTKIEPSAQPSASAPAAASASAQPSMIASPAVSAPPQRIRGSDFGAWDKFDVDRALAELDGVPETATVASPAPAAVAPVITASPPTPFIADLEACLIEKEKGNAYFGKGDYTRAVACYTSSLEKDPRHTASRTNRAMAALKLQRWAAAAADCTSVLDGFIDSATGVVVPADPKNVKALWRRGVARRHLNQLVAAKSDLERARVLDPQQAAVKTELERVLEELELSQQAKHDLPAANVPRRRLFIEEINRPIDEKRSSAAAAAAALPSSHSHALQPATQTALAPVSRPSTEAAQQDPPSPAPADSGLLPPATLSASGTASESSTRALPAVPATLSMFERDWRTLARRPDARAALGAYLAQITPAALPSLFGAQLEAPSDLGSDDDDEASLPSDIQNGDAAHAP